MFKLKNCCKNLFTTFLIASTTLSAQKAENKALGNHLLLEQHKVLLKAKALYNGAIKSFKHKKAENFYKKYYNKISSSVKKVNPDFIFILMVGETGYGSSKIFKETNNIGNVKCFGCKEKYRAEDGSNYVKYKSFEDSVRHLEEILIKRYPGILNENNLMKNFEYIHSLGYAQEEKTKYLSLYRGICGAFGIN